MRRSLHSRIDVGADGQVKEARSSDAILEDVVAFRSMSVNEAGFIRHLVPVGVVVELVCLVRADKDIVKGHSAEFGPIKNVNSATRQRPKRPLIPWYLDGGHNICSLPVVANLCLANDVGGDVPLNILRRRTAGVVGQPKCGV